MKADAQRLQEPRAGSPSSESIDEAHHQLQSFFIHAYSLKDLLKPALVARRESGQLVEDAIDADPLVLGLLADMANLDKHGELTKGRPCSGTKPSMGRVGGVFDHGAPPVWRLRVEIVHGERRVDGLDLVREVIDAWRRELRHLGFV